MKRPFARGTYLTTRTEDLQAGWVAFDLHWQDGTTEHHVARLCFWDAMGQFVFQTFDHEVPLVILEDLIAEARAATAAQ